MLKVNEVFGPTIQGEGTHTGKVCFFIRFSGCNMWNGKEESKKDSACPFCDTSFSENEGLTVYEAYERVVECITNSGHYLAGSMVVFTGGEPMMQDHEDLKNLAEMLVNVGVHCHMETNGSIEPKNNVLNHFRHVTCSPKRNIENLKLTPYEVTSYKILYPYVGGVTKEAVVEHVKSSGMLNKFTDELFIQPMEDISPTNKALMIKEVVEQYEHEGRWRISLQTHKILGVD